MKTYIKKEALAAEIIGMTAHQLGKICVPAMDSNLDQLLVGKGIGEAKHIYKGWISGWTKANLI